MLNDLRFENKLKFEMFFFPKDSPVVSVVVTLAFAGPPKFTAMEQRESRAVHAQENMDVLAPCEQLDESVVQVLKLFFKFHRLINNTTICKTYLKNVNS